jgi:hypothetical protein
MVPSSPSRILEVRFSILFSIGTEGKDWYVSCCEEASGLKIRHLGYGLCLKTAFPRRHFLIYLRTFNL